MSFPPVLLFVHQRHEQLHRVLDQLEACAGFAEHPVVVHSDGPRTAEEALEVAAVRELVRGRMRPNMQLIEQPTNRGLANSIIAEVTAACAAYGEVIVIEDDLVLAPAALAWFRESLARYRHEPRVMQIAGFNFDLPAVRNAGRSVFMGHPTSWGWATNAESWARFDPNCLGWEAMMADPDFRRRFTVGNAMRFATMLERQMAGQSDSWAIRWHFAVVRDRGLVVFPPESMVDNIGHRIGKATHGQRSAHLLPTGPLWNRSSLPRYPDFVALDEWAVTAWSRRLRWSAYGAAMRLSATRDFLNRA